MHLKSSKSVYNNMTDLYILVNCLPKGGGKNCHVHLEICPLKMHFRISET